MMHNKYMIFSSFLMSQTIFLSGMDNKSGTGTDPLLVAGPLALSLLTHYSAPKKGKKIKFKVPGTEHKVHVPEKVDTVIRYVYPLVQKATIGNIAVGLKQELFDEPYVADRWDKLTSQGAFVVTRVGLDIGLDHSRECIKHSWAGPYINDGLNSVHHCSETVVSSLPSVMQGPTRLVVDKGASLSKEGLLMYGAHKLSNTLLNNDSDHATKTSLAALAVGEVVGKFGKKVKNQHITLVTDAFRGAARENLVMSSGYHLGCDDEDRWGIKHQGFNIAVGTVTGVVLRIPYISALSNRMMEGWSPERRALMKSMVSFSFKIVAYGMLHLLRPYLKPFITGKK
jgi:hypothetical protein